jgi:phosphoenolpyruvate-protein kinase (PTS system EI component)
VAEYHHPFHPAFLHALKRVADAAHAAGKPVTVCGEMAGDPVALPLLLGLGLTSLSIAPGAADGVRTILDRLAMPDCRDLVARALELSTADEIRREATAFTAMYDAPDPTMEAVAA